MPNRSMPSNSTCRFYGRTSFFRIAESIACESRRLTHPVIELPPSHCPKRIALPANLAKAGAVWQAWSCVSLPVPDLYKNSPEVEAAFLAVPEECVAEILDGELHVQPRPRVRHVRAASRLGARLAGFDQSDSGGPSGWIILHEPELHLGPRPDKVVPDLAGWRRERMPELPDTAAIELAPDWVCEVLSDRTERVDRTKKRRIYAREGVGNLWLVSPDQRMLEVFRLQSEHWVLLETFEGDSVVRAEPFDAIELPLGSLWER